MYQIPWVRVNGMSNGLIWSFDFDLRDIRKSDHSEVVISGQLANQNPGKRTNQKAGYKKKQSIDSIDTKSSFYKKNPRQETTPSPPPDVNCQLRGFADDVDVFFQVISPVHGFSVFHSTDQITIIGRGRPREHPKDTSEGVT
jgi:hypothetical protein